MTDPRPVLIIPRIKRPPTIEDFLDMKPNDAMEGRLAKVEGFIQQAPSDGESSSQRTEVYLGYDDRILYVLVVAFDSEPAKIRARLTPRDNISDDDWAYVMIDTFQDQRRGYIFAANPLGVQYDALWTEGVEGNPAAAGRSRQVAGPSGGADNTFDTLWHSRGRLTDKGYLIWMAIPFESLRFPSTPQQTWAIIFLRQIPRVNERAYWPRVSSRIEGRLNQAARLEGLEDISPGRNIQLIPYGTFRSFRAVDTHDDQLPQFVRGRADADAGLDAKLVLKDSLVLDMTLNPDFSQVESDDPKVTANQRFEVFLPEKRPFFLENASFFQTPINLVFTQRIADPQLGVRLTGKLGPYAIGAMLIDDQSPSKRVPESDPLANKRALFGIVRVNRDMFLQSTLGLIFANRELQRSSNRVGGIDGRIKLNQNWVASFQGVASSTKFLDGNRLAGPAFEAHLIRTGLHFNHILDYNDRSAGFTTLTGFDPRPDIRRVAQFTTYQFRPEKKHLLAWGPHLDLNRVWDHQETRLDWMLNPWFNMDFSRGTSMAVGYKAKRERLRPQDFPELAGDHDFSHSTKRFLVSTSYLPQVTLSAFYAWGTDLNVVPPPGQEPTVADLATGDFGLTVRPLTPLRIDNAYLLTRLRDRASGNSILNNHIIRSKWNWQFNRELSLRVILQYDSTLTNPDLTALETSKNLNADLLLTYLVNPGTVLFIGYNGNAQNIDLLPTSTGAEVVRNRHRFINDARQFFVKFSYLLRF